MKKEGRLTLILLAGLFFSLTFVSALDADRIIVNSENWEDVYSTLLYSNLVGAEGDFLTSTQHGPLLLNGISTESSIGIVSSQDIPFVFGYEGTVASRGYDSVEEIFVDEANLELIGEPELDDIDNFIVVGNSYGYSAIAVTAYAVEKRSWVFLADRVNIAEIENILSGRDINELLIYGYLERDIADALAPFNPRYIDSGDRFKDNVDIVEEFKALKNTQQVLLSNGEFIEKELMSGIHPVLFTGRENVPDQIATYLKDSDISVGVLVGNELINAATNIRRDAGISVMVKFAQGARARVAGVSAVEGLDLFYLPTPTLNLGIHSIKYNRASSKVEVTYQSTSNIPVYLKGTLTLTSDEGDNVRVGDLDPIFIAPNDFKTVTYPDVTLEGQDVQGQLVTLFGEVPTSLDRQLTGEFDLNIVNVLDKCEIEPLYVKYNIQRETFVIGIENLGATDCYVDIELEDVQLNNRGFTLGTEGSTIIPAGKKGKIEIAQVMTEEDLNDNPFIELVAYYGEREDTLVNLHKERFELSIQRYTITTYLIGAGILLLIILIIWFFLLKRRRKDEDEDW